MLKTFRPYRIGDSVKLVNSIDENVYLIERCDSHYTYCFGIGRQDVWYSLRSKDNKKYIEDVSHQEVRIYAEDKEVHDIDELLDLINKYKELESLFGDGEYADKMKTVEYELKRKLS